MKVGKFVGLWLGLMLGSVPVMAADDSGVEVVRKRLEGIQGLNPDRITPTPIAGLYEVVLGPHVFYVSGDGKFMVQGDVIELSTRRNLTEPARSAAQSAAIESIGADNMLVYGPDKPKHTVTVFTDIDCGYCRKLHREMDEINAKGIQVRYLLYPRAGVKSDSYSKAVSVWCADDRNDAMTKAKTGSVPPKKECDNPVKEHMAMGQMIGVRGTPTIILEDGTLLPGYVPAARLEAMLAGKQAR